MASDRKDWQFDLKLIGIIAEYNPFHNGHAYQIKKVREIFAGEDVCIVAIMSGDFVQRGFPAIVDKYQRTRMALLGGVDAVVELPISFALSSAEGFARGGVELAKRLGLDGISYGCEADECEMPAIKKIAEVLAEEPYAYRSLLKGYIKEGKNFPTARSLALAEYFDNTGEDLGVNASEILSEPNNILAIEYEKAALQFGEGLLSTYPIHRKGEGYFESGELIREAIFKGDESLNKKMMPGSSVENLNYYVDLDDFSELLFYKLLMKSEEELTDYLDVTDEIAARILKYAKEAKSFSQLTLAASSKNFTQARIRRCLMHCLLEIKGAGGVQEFARVLGFRKSSVALREMKKRSSIELITKLADAPNGAYFVDEKAAGVYNQIVENRWKFEPADEYHAGPIIID